MKKFIKSSKIIHRGELLPREIYEIKGSEHPNQI